VCDINIWGKNFIFSRAGNGKKFYEKESNFTIAMARF
jgi:hypothetical protein